MKRSFAPLLRCPACQSAFDLTVDAGDDERVESGRLTCAKCGKSYPIVRSIPRFVSSDNYANSFGFQWNRFRRTQLDSHTGLPLSRDRLRFSTGWDPVELRNQTILDIGCGAGRFTEVAAGDAEQVIAVDYSDAVEACRENLRGASNVEVVQADIYRLPFPKRSFRFVYCLGVLQHTPDVQEAFRSLAEHVAEDGRLAVDVYPKLWRNVLWSKYWVRPLTKTMSRGRLFSLVEAMVRYLLPISLVVGRIPVVGRRLRYAIPVANHEPDFPLTPEQVREWAVLNTFDMLAPAHDHPQSAKTLTRWFSEAGFRKVEVFRRGHLIGRGIRMGPAGR